MSEIYCPSCGKEHTSNNRYCTYCGADLEPVILKFKGKRLPVSYNNGKTQRVQVVGTDPEDFQGSVRRVPRRRTRNALSGFTIIAILAIVAVGVYYYYNPEAFGIGDQAFTNFLYIIIGLAVLLLIFGIPSMISTNRLRSGGRRSCYSSSRYRGSRYADCTLMDILLTIICFGMCSGDCND